MKKIYFNGDLGVHAARYKIITRDKEDGYGEELAVFVTQKLGDGCSLINSNVGGNKVINQILEQELNGIDLQYIHFYYQSLAHQAMLRHLPRQQWITQFLIVGCIYLSCPILAPALPYIPKVKSLILGC